MQKIDFIKMHGLGNDFVIIDNRIENIDISKNLIHQLSDRKSGAGCDQLITINSSNESDIDASIEIFNSNGDRAEALKKMGKTVITIRICFYPLLKKLNHCLIAHTEMSPFLFG